MTAVPLLVARPPVLPPAGPAPLPIPLAVHGRPLAVSLVHALVPLDQASHEARWATALQGILDVQEAEQKRSPSTVFRNMDQLMTSVVEGWMHACCLPIPLPKRHRRTEKQLRDDAESVAVGSLALATVHLIMKSYRSPDQRMFDALERHDHTALRRALAAGASVHARFVTDTYDDGRRHGCAQGSKEPINVTGQRPAVFAVLEDDVIALRILLDAGAPRRDALGVLNVVEDQGIERERIRWCLETPELDAVVAREGGATTGRERRRL